MAKLTISDAARACRVARSTLQRAVQAGRLSLDADHRVDTAELLRAGYTLHAARQDQARRTQHAALQDAAERSSSTRQDAAGQALGDAALMQHTIAALERENALLRAALDAAAAREQEAQVNAQAAREERALLLHMLQEMQQRYDRLLEAPRPASVSASAPRAPAAAEPPAAPRRGRPSGPVRQRILTLLRAHPEGLRAEEIRVYLKADKPIGDMLQGMRKAGVVTTRGQRPDVRYVAAP
jgi:hypothetical protein